MQRVQAVKIVLSTGVTGIFWGPVIVEEPSSGEEPTTVADITFEAPRVISGDAATPPS